jgi:hypothetical protein
MADKPRIVKAVGSSTSVYVSNGIHKRLTANSTEVAQLLLAGLAEWNDALGKPYEITQTALNNIRTV